jgi:hypothetical protein
MLKRFFMMAKFVFFSFLFTSFLFFFSFSSFILKIISKDNFHLSSTPFQLIKIRETDGHCLSFKLKERDFDIIKSVMNNEQDKTLETELGKGKRVVEMRSVVPHMSDDGFGLSKFDVTQLKSELSQSVKTFEPGEIICQQGIQVRILGISLLRYIG